LARPKKVVPENVISTPRNVEGSTKVRTKKGARGIPGNEWYLISGFLDNKSYTEMAEELGVTEQTVKTFITSLAKTLFASVETKKLIESQAMDLAGRKYSWAPTKALDSQVNRKFVQLLSEADSPILTEEEQSFCYLLVYEGNAKEALKDSGLDIGLSKSMGVAEYNRLLELRVTYLKTKPNLRDYMRELQVKYVDDLKVSKVTIQAELMRTITHLRNQDDPKNAPTIAKLLTDLGRTEGVFIDKSEVDTRFSLDDSFEIMLQGQQALAVPEEPVVQLELTKSGTYVDPSIMEETYDSIEE
jgi:hypothetical protein